MHKEQIQKLREYANDLREKLLEKMVEDNFETAKEKECTLIAIQFLPLFSENKPLSDYLDYYCLAIKQKVLKAFRELDISSEILEEAYSILKLTSFCGPFEKETIFDLAKYLNDSIENLADKPFVPYSEEEKHPFFGDTESYYKHHRKKTIFDKKR